MCSEWHVAVPLFAAAVAFAWSAGAGPLPLVMLALSIATLGIYAAVGTFWALPSSILTGTERRGRARADQFHWQLRGDLPGRSSSAG